MTTLFTAQRLHTISVLLPLVKDTPLWGSRWDIEAYVSRCESAGFCNTDDMRRLCAQRYIAGKRKVTPPGAKRRKREAEERRKLMANLPAELLSAVEDACQSPAASQYRDGNEKALNSLVGMVLKKHRTDAALVRELLTRKIMGEAST